MEWIPVSERLPEQRERVIFYDKDQDIVDVGGPCAADPSFWLSDMGEIPDSYSSVTHWMSLPDSPKVAA